MPFRFSATRVLLGFAVLLAAAPVHAAEFTDSAGRRVTLPAGIERIMPAGPASAVFVYVLDPQKLIGWPLPLTRAQRALLPAKFARLPVIGQLGGQFPTASAVTVMRLHPDLIIGYGKVSPPTVALADRVQQQTHVPYILLDDDIQVMPELLRDLNLALGGGDHGREAARYITRAIGELRGRLLISSPTDRPTVYYGRGPDGLEAALPGSASASVIEQAGLINVAGALGRGGIVQVSRGQLLGWNPQFIIAQERPFYSVLLHNPQWRGFAAVRARKVYLAPANPFGWINDPPGVNRTIGLYWLSALFYPNLSQQSCGNSTSCFTASG